MEVNRLKSGRYEVIPGKYDVWTGGSMAVRGFHLYQAKIGGEMAWIFDPERFEEFGDVEQGIASRAIRADGHEWIVAWNEYEVVGCLHNPPVIKSAELDRQAQEAAIQEQYSVRVSSAYRFARDEDIADELETARRIRDEALAKLEK